MRSSPQEFEVPAMSARVFVVRRGETLRVVDVAGGQPGDLVAYCLDDPTETFGQARTRVENRSCRVRAGDRLWTTAMPARVMFHVVADDTDGMHDLLFTPCCRHVLATRFHVERDGCHEHLAEAIAGHGLDTARLPDPLNLFFHVGIGTDGSLTLAAHTSRPGASITLVAEMDCVVAIATCSVPIAGRENSPYLVQVSGTTAD